MKKTGIFGGTFDPVHLGHLRAAEEFGRAMGLDRVMMVMSARPPHRGEPSAPAEARMNMLAAAVADNDLLEASDMELARGGPSYTVETVEAVTAMAGGMPWLALGADAWREIGSWHRPGDVLARSHVVVITRPGCSIKPDEMLPEGYRDLYEVADGCRLHRDGGTLRTLEVTALDISSSRLRQMMSHGRSIRYLVPSTVFQYIHRNGLYGVG